MALDRPLAPEASPVEPPSSYAELVVQLGPAQPWGTAKGKVPPGARRSAPTGRADSREPREPTTAIRRTGSPDRGARA